MESTRRFLYEAASNVGRNWNLPDLEQPAMVQYKGDDCGPRDMHCASDTITICSVLGLCSGHSVSSPIHSRTLHSLGLYENR